MGVPGPDFRVANDEGWYRQGSFQMGATTTTPWAGVPAWASGTAYGPSSCCTQGGDLYVARPGLSPFAWTSAGSFDADTAGGASRWLRVGIALAWMRVPIDLTGAALLFRLLPLYSDGRLASNTSAFEATNEDGGFTVTNAAQGGWKLSVPLDRTRDVAAGLYAYAMYAGFADGSVKRLRYGRWIVDQGIA